MGASSGHKRAKRVNGRQWGGGLAWNSQASDSQDSATSIPPKQSAEQVLDYDKFIQNDFANFYMLAKADIGSVFVDDSIDEAASTYFATDIRKGNLDLRLRLSDDSLTAPDRTILREKLDANSVNWKYPSDGLTSHGTVIADDGTLFTSELNVIEVDAEEVFRYATDRMNQTNTPGLTPSPYSLENGADPSIKSLILKFKLFDQNTEQFEVVDISDG